MHSNFLFCLPGHDLSAIANSIGEKGETFLLDAVWNYLFTSSVKTVRRPETKSHEMELFKSL